MSTTMKFFDKFGGEHKVELRRTTSDEGNRWKSKLPSRHRALNAAAKKGLVYNKKGNVDRRRFAV